VAEHKHARRREAERPAPRRALEQPRAEDALQGGDLLADR
jgi:hypothetical protein